MDAWTFVFDWWRRFGTERVLHATAHDVLMAAPGLGDYFRQAGVIPASRARRQRSAQRRVRRGHLAGGRRRRDAQLAQAR